MSATDRLVEPETLIEGEVAKPAAELLCCAIATLIEHADTEALQRFTDREAEVERGLRLARVGADVGVLGAAIEVMGRRLGPTTPELPDE